MPLKRYPSADFRLEPVHSSDPSDEIQWAVFSDHLDNGRIGDTPADALEALANHLRETDDVPHAVDIEDIVDNPDELPDGY